MPGDEELEQGRETQEGETGAETEAEEETQEGESSEAEGESSEAEGEEEEKEEERQEAGAKDGKGKKVVYDAKYWKGQYLKEREKRQAVQRGLAKREEGKGKETGAETKGVKSLDQVKTVKDFADYLLSEARAEVKAELTEKDKQQRMVSTQEKARESHDGSDGLPPYDELVDEFVLPLIEKNPNIYHLLREMPDPAEAAYTLGFLLKYPNFRELIKGQGREELVKKINETAKKAVTIKGQKETAKGGKLSAADIMAMGEEEFEKEIAKAKGLPA